MMFSIDTNILFPAIVKQHAQHSKASAWLNSLTDSRELLISEFILVELYVLLRNPILMPEPLTSEGAVETCDAFRKNPKWQVVGFPEKSAAFHVELWKYLRKPIARRRAYDIRTARALIEVGATEFATQNVKDFEGVGFARVWNPLA